MPDEPTFRALLDAALALASDEDASQDAWWEAIRPLHDADSEAAYALLQGLLTDSEPRTATLAVDALRWFAHGAEPWKRRTRALLLETLAGGPEPDVIAAIGKAAIDLDEDYQLAERMLLYQAHHDADVRSAVVHAVLRWKDPRAVAVLVTRSADPEADIRNWATFGLAQATGATDAPLDVPELRRALWTRMGDPEPEVRAEAALGLALRGDVGVRKAVAAELEGEGPAWGQWIEAAGALGDPSLLPALEDLRDLGWQEKGGSGVIDEAIAALRDGR